jgi:cytochrome c biogenesis protein CcmG, thiol:disulfide interchange protein DsbE
MRVPTVAGGLLGLLVALAVLVLVVGGLGPTTILPPGPSLPSATISTVTPGPSGSPDGPTATFAPVPTSPPVGVQVGDRAPALKLAALGGGTVDLAATRGKPTWVSFTASWCPSCRDDLGLMNRFRQELGSQMAMIVVDVRESSDTVASLVASTDIQAPVGLDSDGAVSAVWQAYVLPVHFWIDSQGIVRSVLYGAAPPDAFIHAIQTVLPGASLTP